MERRVTFVLKTLAVVALGVVCVGGVLSFLARIPGVVIVAVGATFFTYAIYPVVRRLNAQMPLLWAIVVVYLTIGAVLAVAVATIVPALIGDLQSVVAAMPRFVRVAQDYLTNTHNPVLAHLPAPIRSYLASLPPQIESFARRYASEGAPSALAFVLSFVSLIATIVVIPVVSIYLMIEAPVLLEGLLLRLPPRVQQRAALIVRDLDKALGGFIRGQLVVGATIGVCIIIALLILHVRYAVLIGVVAGLFDVIPFVGAAVGFVPAVTLALVDDGWQHALVVAVVFVAIFQAEGHFIAPRIVSESVGLSPLMVIVAILVGGELLGIGGMFLAVPVAAAVRVFFLHAFPPRRNALVASPVEPVRDTAGIPGEQVPKPRRAEVPS